MLKKLVILFAALFLVVSLIPQTSEASTKIQAAIFDSFVYTTDDAGNKVVEYVVLENAQGKTNRYKVDDSAYFYINNTVTSAAGFKYGMEIDVTRNNLGKVVRLEGYSDVDTGAIVENSRELAGTVVTIDPNGDYITVKLDTNEVDDYYVMSDTEFFKGTQNVDFSFMYEGDRVKLKFSEANSNTLSEVEIIQDGVVIENLYRGSLNNVNTISNRLTVKGTTSFTDWDFTSLSSNGLKTYKFNNATTIYYGNKLIKKTQLRNYRNSDVYFVTTKINNEEIVKKMVVLQNFERTFYDQINLINTSSKYFRLASSGIYNYHNGSILIRNGRLVDAASLSTSGSAFVLTDGKTTSKYTHVVNVTNDSFLSPNLASHKLYFGMLSSFDNKTYTVRTSDMLELTNNYWKSTTSKQLSFSNNSVFTRNIGTNKILATDLTPLKSKFGYFYVKDGHIVTAHFLENSDTRSDKIFTGRLASVDSSGNSMSLNDVTQWKNGTWTELSSVNSIKLSQALIIKNGEVISASALKRSNRVVVISDANFYADIVLINE